MPVVEFIDRHNYIIKSVPITSKINHKVIIEHPTGLSFGNSFKGLTKEIKARIENGEIVIVAAQKIIKIINKENIGKCDCERHWNK